MSDPMAPNRFPSPDPLDVMSSPIDVEQPDQVSNTQPAKFSPFSFSERSVGQFPLVLLQISNTLINAVFDTQSSHIDLLDLSDSMTSVDCLILCFVSFVSI
jgi:hypothetical protein